MARQARSQRVAIGSKLTPSAAEFIAARVNAGRFVITAVLPGRPVPRHAHRELGPGPDAELPVDVGEVQLDGAHAHKQPARCLAVCRSRRDGPGHASLGGG